MLVEIWHLSPTLLEAKIIDIFKTGLVTLFLLQQGIKTEGPKFNKFKISLDLIESRVDERSFNDPLQNYLSSI